MSLNYQILILFNCFLVAFVFIRGFLNGVKHFRLNNSACKKKKAGETLKEWLLYSRYREDIPKSLLVLYFLILVIHIVGLIGCILFHITQPEWQVGEKIIWIVVLFDLIWITMVGLLFWSPGRDFAYGRFIDSKRRNNKTKR